MGVISSGEQYRIEMLIYKHQEALIRLQHGKDACDNANYGNGVTVLDNTVSVETKVYGVGRLVTTVLVEEEWVPY